MILINGNPKYPTTYSDSSYPTFQYERTDSVKSLGDGFSCYWLGYMNYDNIPTALQASQFSGTEDIASAKVVNLPANSPVGYATDNYGYGTLISSIFKENDFTTGSNYSTYLNNFHVPSSAVQIAFSTGSTTGCQLWVSVETGADASLGTHLEKDLEILSDDDRTTTGLIEFLLGNRDISFNYTINGVTVTHTLKSQDLEDNGIVDFIGVANGLYYKMSVFIAGYGFNPYPGRDYTLTNQRTYHINPCLKMFSEYGNYYAIKSNGIYAGTNTRYDIATHTFYNLQSWGAYIPGIGALGGWDFEFSNDDISDLSTYEILYNGNTIAYKLSTIVEMWRVFKPSDLVHHFALLMRIPSGVSYGYHVGIYCPEVHDDGEFTGKLLTGELTEEDVQPWQWGNIQVNEFTENDVPEYIPLTPEDDDSKSSGVDYTPNTAFAIDTASGFVTQYVLTPSQLGNFGQYLWANMFDEDFLDSIMVSLGESLSVDPSNILKYIVSVRYFPFSFTNRYGMSLVSDTIYIGRGVKGIELHSGSKIGLFDSYCEDIDGGYADVPYPDRIGQNFRAYEPCTSVHVIVPFCGVVELTPSQAIGSRIKLKYCVDFSTGAIQAAITIVSDITYIAAILNGNIGATVELSASNLVQVLQKGVSVATSIVKGAAMLAVGAGSAGAGAAMTDEAIESSQMMSQGASEAGKGITNLATLEGVSPTTCSMTSGFSSFHVTKPIVMVTHKHYEIPTNYGHAVGYACNKTVTLGSLEGKGFTVCKNVDLTGVPATQDELIALEKLLQSGVYL